MAHPNEDLIRKGYGAFASGDMATLNELFDDDIVWHAPGRNQLAGTFLGKQAVFGEFQRVAEFSGGTFKLEIHTVLADDEHVAVLARAMGEREGRTLDDNSVQIFHVKDGKVTEQWLYPGDVYASDEFWG
jgi:uncharacterized protein